MKEIFIKPSESIKKALKQITKASSKCLVVVDDNNLLIGTLSDGDIRKAILSGIDLTELIDKYYNPGPTYYFQNDYTLDKIKKTFIKSKFDIIPIVNSKGIVKDVITWDKVFSENKNKIKDHLNVPVVIMAGGIGTRLLPFTKVLPKPLIPINDKSIIEHIIGYFNDYGCDYFFLTVNYKARIIKAYFEELNYDYSLNFIEENEPLGTAGSLTYLHGKIKEPFFVTNCDIIVKTNYFKLYEFHKKGNFDITLVASAKEYVIPYGTCELNNDGSLSKISEKPEFDLLTNAGLYIINPDILKLIPNGKVYHITQLIEDANSIGKKVGVFPIDDSSWIDVGQWSEYRKAADKL